MNKERILSAIKAQGIIAVVRGKNAEHAINVAEACIEGGVTCIELTFTTPHAHEAIRTLSQKYADDPTVIIGAGTVLDAITARIAILEGAQFIVSPAFDAETIKLCHRYQIAVMPGTTTLSGVIEAMEAGADIIKIFPGELAGSAMIRAIHGPLPQAVLMPTGGVTPDNAGAWLNAGCIAVGAGGSLTKGADKNDFAAVTEQAKKFVQAIAVTRT